MFGIKSFKISGKKRKNLKQDQIYKKMLIEKSLTGNMKDFNSGKFALEVLRSRIANKVSMIR